MILKKFNLYLDGGSLEFITSEGTFYYDYDCRLPLEERGKLRYSGAVKYEKNRDIKVLNETEINEKERELAQAILDFVPDGKTWMLEDEETKQGLISMLKEQKVVFKD